MAVIDIKVPDIGDFDEVGVVEVLVQPGDTIRAEQGLITVLTDAWLWQNRTIDQYDNAWLLWYLTQDSQVQLVYRADRDSLAARLADRTLCIGPAESAKSYLQIETLLMAAGVTCNSSAACWKLRWRPAASKARKEPSGGRR